jgi:crotonobetainyl-CoA:carnitine CoA-transferase CaiB-like acyl-CoA transferase
MKADLPLQGIRVIDLGQVYAGPYCTSQLAYLGADIIKIEPPGIGEYLRMLKADGDVGYAFMMLNANKKSVALNLKIPSGREVLMRLLKDADVLVENFLDGAMEELSLGYDQIADRFPRLIYASGRGYGAESKWSRLGATDYTVQASCGMVSATGYPDRPGVRTPATFIDMGMGIHLAAGILAALLSRGRTGRGQRVEVAMHDVCIPAMTRNLAIVFDGSSCERLANRHPGIAPSNHYKTEDGEISIFCMTESHWQKLLKLMHRQDLNKDPRFRSPSSRSQIVDEVDTIVAAWTANRKRDELVDLLVARGIPCAPVRSVEEVAFDPEVAEREMLKDTEYPTRGSVKVLGTPLKLSQRDIHRPILPLPSLGQHTEEVLTSIGITRAELKRLREEGVV